MIPLLLLPGMLCDAAYWQPQADDLADICESTIPSYDLLDTIEGMARHALARTPGQFAVCGHSMGGRIVQEIYRLAPERVLGLGLFGTDYRAAASKSERIDELNSLLKIAERAEELGMGRFSREWAIRLLPAERHGDQALIDSIAAMIARQSPEMIRAQSRAGAMRRDYTDLLPAIRCPTLVCAGALDVLRPIGPHEYMARTIPRARLVSIPGAGHMMSMERPRETALAMRDWLAQVAIANTGSVRGE